MPWPCPGGCQRSTGHWLFACQPVTNVPGATGSWSRRRRLTRTGMNRIQYIPANPAAYLAVGCCWLGAVNGQSPADVLLKPEIDGYLELASGRSSHRYPSGICLASSRRRYFLQGRRRRTGLTILEWPPVRPCRAPPPPPPQPLDSTTRGRPRRDAGMSAAEGVPTTALPGR
ncbi:hypothetical protein P154DRAFT_571475 [Amniculicola lignicola CBS 123094]|uniref:Uncharacterized protein n=1 Tax=Amniculicola lignicola CBS 123094 TaxID=1392246 RepID=A0A6A5WVV8_9PLEO|nr:hypothetical protein P154DRAFT_571475 [Amniculicola lignicola CBS 123094]